MSPSLLQILATAAPSEELPAWFHAVALLGFGAGGLAALVAAGLRLFADKHAALSQKIAWVGLLCAISACGMAAYLYFIDSVPNAADSMAPSRPWWMALGIPSLPIWINLGLALKKSPQLSEPAA
jgi:uncharacterized membrane protein YebE (DUF533 family)